MREHLDYRVAPIPYPTMTAFRSTAGDVIKLRSSNFYLYDMTIPVTWLLSHRTGLCEEPVEKRYNNQLSCANATEACKSSFPGEDDNEIDEPVINFIDAHHTPLYHPTNVRYDFEKRSTVFLQRCSFLPLCHQPNRFNNDEEANEFQYIVYSAFKLFSHYPGHYHKSDKNANLAAYIIEKRIRKELDWKDANKFRENEWWDYLRYARGCLDRIGLKSTRFPSSPLDNKSLISIDYSDKFAAQGMLSNVDDLVKFVSLYIAMFQGKLCTPFTEKDMNELILAMHCPLPSKELKCEVGMRGWEERNVALGWLIKTRNNSPNDFRRNKLRVSFYQLGLDDPVFSTCVKGTVLSDRMQLHRYRAFYDSHDAATCEPVLPREAFASLFDLCEHSEVEEFFTEHEHALYDDYLSEFRFNEVKLAQTPTQLPLASPALQKAMRKWIHYKQRPDPKSTPYDEDVDLDALRVHPVVSEDQIPPMGGECGNEGSSKDLYRYQVETPGEGSDDVLDGGVGFKGIAVAVICSHPHVVGLDQLTDDLTEIVEEYHSIR